MKNIDFARDDGDLYPLLLQATEEEKAFLAEILSGKHSSSIRCTERCPLKLTMELQSMGGDSVMNLLRRRGVRYRQIVTDVANKVAVKYTPDDLLMKTEEKIAEKVIADYKNKLSETERSEFEKILRETLADQKRRMGVNHVAARGVGGMAPALLAVGGFILQRGAIAAIPVVGQFLGVLAGIIGIIFAFTGTAYSVTVPAVLVVGSIRARLMAEQFSSEINL